MRREPDPSELLAAYVDGVSELTPDERRALEERLAADGALRSDAGETRALLGRLRELPPEGIEPDWSALERAIGDAVGPDLPRPWWRRWRWLAPGMALAVAAAALVFWLRDPARETPAPSVSGGSDAPRIAPVAAEAVETMALWLDGEELEVELVADELLVAPWEDSDADDLLPALDLGWVDALDGEELQRAEEWLARKPG